MRGRPQNSHSFVLGMCSSTAAPRKHRHMHKRVQTKIKIQITEKNGTCLYLPSSTSTCSAIFGNGSRPWPLQKKSPVEGKKVGWAGGEGKGSLTWRGGWGWGGVGKW